MNLIKKALFHEIKTLYKYERFKEVLKMDNKVIRLQVLDNKVEEKQVVEEKTTTKYTNVSNPIYKKMLAFHNAKIGEKLTISDILR